jgi:hypothetical protein
MESLQNIGRGQYFIYFWTLMKGECTRDELGKLSIIWKNRQATKSVRKTPVKKVVKNQKKLKEKSTNKSAKSLLRRSSNMNSKQYLITLSTMGLEDPWIRNLTHKVVRANNEREALKKYILTDNQGVIIDKIIGFAKQWKDKESTEYYKLMKEVGLIDPENTDALLEEDKEAIAITQDFYKNHINGLLKIFESFAEDGREIKIYEIEEDQYLM